MTDDDNTRQARHAAIQAEYAEEEAEAAELEAAEHAAALDVPLNLRITRTLNAQLRQRAAAQHIPTSSEDASPPPSRPSRRPSSPSTRSRPSPVVSPPKP